MIRGHFSVALIPRFLAARVQRSTGHLLRLRLRISPKSRAWRIYQHNWFAVRCQRLPGCGMETCPVRTGSFRSTRSLPNRPEQIQVMPDVSHIASQLDYMPNLLRKSAPMGEIILTHPFQIDVGMSTVAA